MVTTKKQLLFAISFVFIWFSYYFSKKRGRQEHHQSVISENKSWHSFWHAFTSSFFRVKGGHYGHRAETHKIGCGQHYQSYFLAKCELFVFPVKKNNYYKFLLKIKYVIDNYVANSNTLLFDSFVKNHLNLSIKQAFYPLKKLSSRNPKRRNIKLHKMIKSNPFFTIFSFCKVQFWDLFDL